MTIIELIKELETLKEKYGDKEVLTYNQDFSEYEYINGADYVNLDNEEYEEYYNEDWDNPDPNILHNKYTIPQQFIVI